ncbi:hypothetical protein HY991_01230 [Candidatus Micrarchaeota archaeon]|nr:hypothetical protein [Candidatus Micrarchaeota archaeon]
MPAPLPKLKTTVKHPTPGVSAFYFYPEVFSDFVVRQRSELHVRLPTTFPLSGNIRVRRWNFRNGELEKKWTRVRHLDEAVRQAIHVHGSIMEEVAENRGILLALSKTPSEGEVLQLAKKLGRVRHPDRISARDALLTKDFNGARQALKKRNEVLLKIEAPFFLDREKLLRGLYFRVLEQRENNRAIREINTNEVLATGLAPNASFRERRQAANFLTGMYNRLRDIPLTYIERVKTELAAAKARGEAYVQGREIDESTLIKPAPHSVAQAIACVRTASKEFLVHPEAAHASLLLARDLLLERNKQIRRILWRRPLKSPARIADAESRLERVENEGIARTIELKMLPLVYSYIFTPPKYLKEKTLAELMRACEELSNKIGGARQIAATKNNLANARTALSQNDRETAVSFLIGASNQLQRHLVNYCDMLSSKLSDARVRERVAAKALLNEARSAFSRRDQITAINRLDKAVRLLSERALDIRRRQAYLAAKRRSP